VKTFKQFREEYVGSILKEESNEIELLDETLGLGGDAHSPKRVQPRDHLSKLNPQTSKDYPSERNIPSVISFRRKSVRVFSDNQKIALYYAPAIDKYISIPFSDNPSNAGIHINEKLEKLRVRHRTTPLNQKQYSTGIYAAPTSELVRHKGGVRAGISAINRSGADGWKKSGAAIGLLARKALDRVVRGKANRHIKHDDVGEPEVTVKPRRGTPAPAPTPKNPNSPYAAKQVSGAKQRILQGKSVKPAVDVWREQNEQLDEVAIAPIVAGAGKLAMGAGRAIAGGAVSLGKKIGGKIRRMRRNSARDRLRSTGRRVNVGDSGGNNNNNNNNNKSSDDAEPRDIESKHEFGRPLGTIHSAMRNKTAHSRAGEHLNVASQKRVAKAWAAESTNMEKIRAIAESKSNESGIQFNENHFPINKRIAKKVVSVYESLNSENKTSFEQMLNEGPEPFKKAINFAVRA